MKVLSEEMYSQITRYLSSYRGLLIESERELVDAFPEIEAGTVIAIISKHGQSTVRNRYHSIARRSREIIAE